MFQETAHRFAKMTCFHPYMSNGFSHFYLLDEFIASFRPRVVGRCFIFFILKSNIEHVDKQTVETLIRRQFMWRLIWVCDVCPCPRK